ncbi:MAG: transcription-repair coupling factor, partial [Flavobacteriaceae bacterium]|nr:transcription-repair coupling factor [Flavobacteriaceae bacterium]
MQQVLRILTPEALLDKYTKKLANSALLQRLRDLEDLGLQTVVSGWNGSAVALHVAALSQCLDKSVLLLLDDKEQAAYLYNDVQKFLGESNSLFYPASYRRPYQSDEVNNANVLLRVECVNKMHAARKPFVMVTYPEAVFEKIISKKAIKSGGISLKQGQEYAAEALNEKLFELNFKRVDFVTEPGEFSLRGGILDVFSFSNDEPYRIEFFGDEIDSIRSFDIETQLSIKKINKIHILSNIEEKQLEEQRVPVFEHLSKEALVFCANSSRIAEHLQSLYDKADESYRSMNATVAQMKPEALFLDKKSFRQALTHRKGVELTSARASEERPSFSFDISPQPVFHKNFDLLIEQLNANTSKNYENLICCASEKQAKRLSDIFSD